MANGTKQLGQRDPGKFENLFAPLQSAPKVTNNIVSIKVGSGTTPTVTKGKVKK
jgi:hypothetical protein